MNDPRLIQVILGEVTLAELEAELAEHESDGNELYAAQVRDLLVVARSPARRVHKAAVPPTN